MGTPTGIVPAEVLVPDMVAILVAAKVPATVGPAGGAMFALEVGRIITTVGTVS